MRISVLPFHWLYLPLLQQPGSLVPCCVSSVEFSSVSQSRPTLCDPVDYSMPDFPVHHHLLQPAQTHVHRVADAIQPSHPLSSPSPPAFNLSQHQGLFHWISSYHEVVKVLEFQLQHQSFQCIFRTDFLYDWLVGSPCCPRDSWESSSTTQFKASILLHSAFFIVQHSPSTHDYWKNHNFDKKELCWESNVSAL